MATRTTSSVTRTSPVARERHDALAALEVAHRERRGEARRAARRQHVVRADAVVADRHRRPRRRRRPRRPRSAAPARAAPRVDHLDVLGRERVHRLDALRPGRGRAPRRRGAPRRGGRAPRSRPSAAPSATRRATSSASSRDGVTSTTVSSPLPCSACARRSAATTPASAESSARITTSLGPASLSISTRPRTRRLAAATYALPGPTILSTAGTVSRAEGERRDGLRAAHPVDVLLDAGDHDRRGNRRVGLERAGRRHDHQPRHAGDLRRDRVHQHGRGVGARRRPGT